MVTCKIKMAFHNFEWLTRGGGRENKVNDSTLGQMKITQSSNLRSYKSAIGYFHAVTAGLNILEMEWTTGPKIFSVQTFTEEVSGVLEQPGIRSAGFLRAHSQVNLGTLG